AQVVGAVPQQGGTQQVDAVLLQDDPLAVPQVGVGEVGDQCVVAVGGGGQQQQRLVVEQQLAAAQEARPFVEDPQLAPAAGGDGAAAVEDAEALSLLEHAGALVGTARRGGHDVVLLGSRLRRPHGAPRPAGRGRRAGSPRPSVPP